MLLDCPAAFASWYLVVLLVLCPPCLGRHDGLVVVAAWVPQSSSTTTTTLGATTTTTSSRRRQTASTSLLQAATDTMNDDPSSDVRVLGVCGGIGSGKSTVCQVLVSEFGCLGHIEADRLAHEVYQPHSPVLSELVDAFGSDLVQDDGNLNRAALGKVVFGNPQALQRLEHIVWPHVQALVQERIQQLKDDYLVALSEKNNDEPQTKRPIIIVEAAVLLDAGWNEFSNGVWVVKVEPDVALQRLQEHRNMPKDQALQRIEAQKSRRGMGNLQQEIDQGVVSAVVDNSGDVEALKRVLQEKLNDENAWFRPKTERAEA